MSEKIQGQPEVELRSIGSTEDFETLADWFALPHVIHGWGGQTGNLAEFKAREHDTHAMIVADGVPVGYLCGSLLMEIDAVEAGLEGLFANLVDIDIFIGAPECLGRGIGPQAIELLIKRLAKNPNQQWAGLGTSQANHSAIGAFEKAGFREYRAYENPIYGPCVYMVRALRDDEKSIVDFPFRNC